MARPTKITRTQTANPEGSRRPPAQRHASPVRLPVLRGNVPLRGAASECSRGRKPGDSSLGEIQPPDQGRQLSPYMQVAFLEHDERTRPT